jgi:predicted transcriptional regulator
MRTRERISKAQIVEAMKALPDDAGIEQAIERIYVLYKIQQGLDQLDAGQAISHEEAMQRMARWLA